MYSNSLLFLEDSSLSTREESGVVGLSDRIAFLATFRDIQLNHDII